jgi:hypothetical protein
MILKTPASVLAVAWVSGGVRNFMGEAPAER